MAETLVQNPDAWLTDLVADSINAAGMQAAAADPVLRASAERAFKASFLHWATQNLRTPGARVALGLGDEVVHIARDLIRRGLEDMATAAYRAGQAQALRYLMNIAFSLTQDPEQLKELLDTIAWSISDFVESTVGSVMDMMRTERAEILRASQPELRETVALVLGGAPITRFSVTSRTRLAKSAKQFLHSSRKVAAWRALPPGSSPTATPSCGGSRALTPCCQSRSRRTQFRLPLHYRCCAGRDPEVADMLCSLFIVATIAAEMA